MAGQPETPSTGTITNGPEVTLEMQTAEFVYKQLAKWRDDPCRPPGDSEKKFNPQLSKFLTAIAAKDFPMVQFSHEEPQKGRRTVDIGAGFTENTEISAGTFQTIYEPFMVFECKLLPTPGKKREREYLSGGEEKPGGIQRFKLGLHGGAHATAAIIAYIQEGDAKTWISTINKWIRELADEGASGNEEAWSYEEQLSNFLPDPESNTASARSTHTRTALKPILLRHLWVVMRPQKTDQPDKLAAAR